MNHGISRAHSEHRPHAIIHLINTIRTFHTVSHITSVIRFFCVCSFYSLFSQTFFNSTFVLFCTLHLSTPSVVFLFNKHTYSRSLKITNFQNPLMYYNLFHLHSLIHEFCLEMGWHELNM